LGINLKVGSLILWLPGKFVAFSLRVWYKREAQGFCFQIYAFAWCISREIELNFEKKDLGENEEVLFPPRFVFLKTGLIFLKIHDKNV
jgi:hypothetical protein